MVRQELGWGAAADTALRSTELSAHAPAVLGWARPGEDWLGSRG